MLLAGHQSSRFKHQRPLDSKTSTTTNTRFSQNTVLLTREPASFWRENVVAVVTLRRVLARMSKWGKQVIKCEKFYHFAMGTGCNLPFKVTVLTFLVKNCKMKLSGESIIKEYARKL